MKLKLLTLLFAIAFFNKGFSQDKEVEMMINFLANDKIADVNLEQDEFIESLSQITDYCKSEFVSISEKQKIGILIIVHKTGKPTYQCFSSPQIDKEFEEKILADLNEFEIENTKIVDLPLFISINSINKGEITDFDAFEDPAKKQLADYKNADFQTKLAMLKQYAIDVALPVLSAYEVIVDDQFEGVKKFGQLINTTDFRQAQNIDELTSKNKYFWRAILEMNAGNQLIPITKIYALVSQGEFDYAQKFIEIIRLFSDRKTIADHYLGEIIFRIDLFNEELDKQIELGIAEHDKGNYQGAIDIYDGILKIYPNSSWALYEKYYSENAIKQSHSDVAAADRTDWDVAKVEIYKHNPLYNMDVRASNGKEAYLLFRRQEINDLFENKNDRLKDVFTYAEIATDLGAYDFAAQLFWLTATYDKENSQESINNFLYCLDKLGEKELKSNFKGDFDKIFQSIEKQKEKEMKSSGIYKSMKY